MTTLHTHAAPRALAALALQRLAFPGGNLLPSLRYMRQPDGIGHPLLELPVSLAADIARGALP